MLGSVAAGVIMIAGAALLMSRGQSGGEAAEVEVGNVHVTLYSGVFLFLLGLILVLNGSGIVKIPYLPDF